MRTLDWRCAGRQRTGIACRYAWRSSLWFSPQQHLGGIAHGYLRIPHAPRSITSGAWGVAAADINKTIQALPYSVRVLRGVVVGDKDNLGGGTTWTIFGSRGYERHQSGGEQR